ncbi:Kinesin light chain, partial [Fusarium oxysporum f. sp. albedinis]
CEEYYSNQQLNWQNRFPEDTDLPPAYYAAQILDPIESGHGSGKNGYSKPEKKNKSGLITHNLR